MKIQIKKYKYKILFILFSISLIASLVLSLTSTPLICAKGCDIVQTSSYAKTLGIKNSIYGTFIFLILIYLTFLEIQNHDKIRKDLIHYSVIMGSAIAVYFLYIQTFILNAWCKYCLVVDFSLIVALILIIFTWKK